MTPAESIAANFAAVLVTNGATFPIQNAIAAALDGERLEAAHSSIVVAAHIAEQTSEPAPLFRFSLSAEIVAARDDDKTAADFRDNYEAVWNALAYLARRDNCAALASEGFEVDGFLLDGGNPPTFSDDEYGGSWAASFSASVSIHLTD